MGMWFRTPLLAVIIVKELISCDHQDAPCQRSSPSRIITPLLGIVVPIAARRKRRRAAVCIRLDLVIDCGHDRYHAPTSVNLFSDDRQRVVGHVMEFEHRNRCWIGAIRRRHAHEERQHW